MSHEESISLEETNKIRISLGLKPLGGPTTSTAEDPERLAQDNYNRTRDEAAKAKESKAIADRIAKVRNKQELNAKLKGKTLGEDLDSLAGGSADSEDARKWIKRAKKREKELAKKRMEELESMDKAIQDEYTEKDLVGLKVSHDFDEMDEGDARILTLKDSRILDNEEDELQNVEMAESEREKKNNDLKIKKKDYKGYDDDEFEDGAAGMKRAVLAKYDEDINGALETGFRLGSSSSTRKETRAKEEQAAAATVNKSLLSIDYAKNQETYDYLREGDVGFKKPKTKKKRPSRRTIPDEAGGADAMEVDDEKPVIPRATDLDANFVDDDDLQAALSQSRRAKIIRRNKMTPEEIAAKVAREREIAQTSNNVEPTAEGGTDGLTIDDTSEFVRGIQFDPEAVKVKPEPRESVPPQGPKMEDEDVAMDEIETGPAIKEEEEDDEIESAVLDVIEEAIRDAEKAEKDGGDDVGTTSSEQTFGAGMASTLNILRQSGIIAPSSASQNDREKVQLERDAWLAEQRRRVAKRELERVQSRGANKDQATREYENRLREQQEARDNLEAFKNYKPDVNIVYYDEHGRSLTTKEAWKALSHKFHGKGSGKMKTEKRLKKIADEKKKEAMTSGDTPLSMNSAFQKRQELTGQAHFVLSVGNRGAVPQAAEFFDAQPLAKSKTDKKQKKRDAAAAKAAAAEAETGFITLPAPGVLTAAPVLLDEGGSLSRGSDSPAPVKAGFSRISAAADATTSGTPGQTDRTKVAFGFGTKRKAADEGTGTPESKRRN